MAVFDALRYTGTGVNDNDIVIQTGNVSRYNQFTLMSTAGALDVFVSLDGTNYATAPLSLIDNGATTITTAVTVTAANRIYTFEGTFALIRVLQNGATGAANTTLLCAERPS